jgi:hypothetical protein
MTPNDALVVLADRPFSASGPFTARFQAAGVRDFAGAARLDITGVPPGAAPIERFLHEEPITVEQLGAYKIELHQRFLRDWIARTETVRGRSLDQIWRIREACIAALSAGAPTR